MLKTLKVCKLGRMSSVQQPNNILRSLCKVYRHRLSYERNFQLCAPFLNWNHFYTANALHLQHPTYQI